MVGEATGVGPVGGGNGDHPSVRTALNSAPSEVVPTPHARDTVPHANVSSTPHLATSPHHFGDPAIPGPAKPEAPVRTHVDSVGTLPDGSRAPAGTPGVQRGNVGPVRPQMLVPPAFPGGTAMPSGQIRGVGPFPPLTGPGTGSVPRAGGLGMPTGPGATSRTPSTPGQVPSTSNSNIGRAPTSPGIVGGRPTASPIDRPAGAIPRGAVVGAPEARTPPRGAVGRTAAAGSGPSAQPAGRPMGAVGSRASFPAGRVVGGAPQTAARTPSRATGPGNNERTVASGAPTRGGVSGGVPTTRTSPRVGSSAPQERQTEDERKRQDRRDSAHPATD